MTLDRLTNTGMRLVVHQTYARNVYLDGRSMSVAEFKPDPLGHTGGALNMVPGYAGYLSGNVLAGRTLPREHLIVFLSDRASEE